MIRIIRRVFGAWLAIWLMVPALLFMILIVSPVAFIGARFDAFTKRALRAIDSWIGHGREPIDNGAGDE